MKRSCGKSTDTNQKQTLNASNNPNEHELSIEADTHRIFLRFHALSIRLWQGRQWRWCEVLERQSKRMGQPQTEEGAHCIERTSLLYGVRVLCWVVCVRRRRTHKTNRNSSHKWLSAQKTRLERQFSGRTRSFDKKRETRRETGDASRNKLPLAAAG